MIALMVADITNPMFFDVVRGAEEAAAEVGYTLVMTESQESAQREAASVERIMPMVDGVVLVSTRLPDDRIAALHAEKPIVTMNRFVPGVGSVVPDVTPGINQTIEHLANLGHKSIAYLAGPGPSWMSRHRWDILLAAAVKHGMNIVEMGPNDPTQEGGQRLLTRVRASGVTAVVAYNDLMAIGLLREAAAQDVAIPYQVSIVGFDDIFGTDFTTPAITTVKTPLLELGRLAVQRLLAEVEDPESTTSDGLVVIPGLATSLVVRGSTGPAAK
jgi:LacI family transcriptional regulator